MLIHTYYAQNYASIIYLYTPSHQPAQGERRKIHKELQLTALEGFMIRLHRQTVTVTYFSSPRPMWPRPLSRSPWLAAAAVCVCSQTWIQVSRMRVPQ